MPITLTIPTDIIESSKIPRTQVKQALYIEMAYALYARGITSLGMARKLSKLDKWAFIEGLAERGIQRHYYESELKEDITYASGCK